MAGVRTVPNIEILAVGEWDASTGPFVCTQDDLLSVLAAWDDPAVRSPIVKLGHTSSLGDGEPALGRWANPRLSENGTVLLADAVGVPDWLADCMPTAYPRRSIEGKRGLTTASGRTHRLILTAVSLLGAAYPAVTTLEDVEMLFAAESFEEVQDKFEMVAASSATDKPVVSTEEESNVGLSGKNIAAAVGADDVRRAWYDSLDQRDRYWMWVTQIHVEPQQLIVEDEETEKLFRVSYTIEGDEQVTFADPVEVTVVYQDTSVAASAAVTKVVYTKEESRPSNFGPDAKVDKSEDGMTPEQLKNLGLSEGATADEINARIQHLASLEKPEGGTGEGEQETTEGEGTEEEDTSGTETPGAPGTPPVVVPQQVEAPAGTVLVDAAQFEEMRKQIAASAEWAEKAQRSERDTFIAAAVADGKFPPSRAEHYRKAFDVDAAGTRALIEVLPKGAIALKEMGHGGAGDDIDASEATTYSTAGLSKAELDRINSFKSQGA